MGANDAVVKGEISDRGNKALHITTDGDATSDTTFQFFKNIEPTSGEGFVYEFWYKSDTENVYTLFEGGRDGNGAVPGSGYNMHADIRFWRDGRIAAFTNFDTQTVDYWHPGEWYHVRFKFNPGVDQKYSIEINDRVVTEGRHEDLSNALTRIKASCVIPAGVKASVWIDDIKVTKIYN